MEHRLNWKNLRQNKCAKCRSSLIDDLDVLKCSNLTCNFVISIERFKELGMKMNKEALEVPLYAQGRQVDDLEKREHPLCGFCHEHHDPETTCEGFV